MINELSVKVVIADCLQVHADAITCFVNSNLLPVGEASEQILLSGGQEVVQQQLDIAQVNLGTTLPSTSLTMAGELKY